MNYLMTTSQIAMPDTADFNNFMLKTKDQNTNRIKKIRTLRNETNSNI